MKSWLLNQNKFLSFRNPNLYWYHKIVLNLGTKLQLSHRARKNNISGVSSTSYHFFIASCVEISKYFHFQIGVSYLLMQPGTKKSEKHGIFLICFSWSGKEKLTLESI